MEAIRGQDPQVLGLAVRELWRKVRRRIRVGPAYRWRYSGRTPERVLVVPPDLRLADRHKARDILSGRFLLAGFMVETDGASPFGRRDVHPDWARSLHGFRWLRHLHDLAGEESASGARRLVEDWISRHGGRISRPEWEPAVVARRVIAWLQHSTIVLQGADFPFYRAFLRLLAVQVRYLRSIVGEMPIGEDRLRARIALAYAGLALPVSPATLRAATRNLAFELERQILPDGGHVSRNPQAVLEILADLLPLRQTYATQGQTPPAALIGAIERMFPALRFFRHTDGSLARFNGMGATSHERIAAVLRHDDTAGAPLLHASHSGYERLSTGGTTVVADTGAPPAREVASAAHAGCLSFELSSGRQCFLANSGIDSRGALEFRMLARATAAHNTATLNDTSSCRFRAGDQDRGEAGSALVSGPRKVRSQRTDQPGMQGFVAAHDGYVTRFGLFHERELALRQDGRVLDGTDRFFRQGGAAPDDRRTDLVTVRFHLHPDTELFLDETDQFVIGGPNGEGWTFACDGVVPAIEDSIHFAGVAGPRRSRQIVLAFRAAEVPEVQWRFTRTDISAARRPD